MNLQLVEIPHVSVFTEAMVANYGMSDKIGLLNFGQNDASSQFYKPYSTLAKLATPKKASSKTSQNHSERTYTLRLDMRCFMDECL